MKDAYFSHSWHDKDVELNVQVWRAISEHCNLRVDLEGRKSKAYYINRLEQLIRRSDVFVSVLAYREVPGSTDVKSTDYGFRCSPGSICFEIRLAERARKPRWIIYDERTRFRPVSDSRGGVVYTEIDADESPEQIENAIRDGADRWLESIQQSNIPNSTSKGKKALLLLDDERDDVDDTTAVITAALKDADYTIIDSIMSFHTDAEVIGLLQTHGLLVAEIGCTSSSDVYGMAHAMFLPTIRFAKSNQPDDSLPRLLSGHPGGYQHDLISAEDHDKLASEVNDRARSMRDSRKTVAIFDEGAAYFRSELYRPHRIFISHNLQDEDADLNRKVFDLLEPHGIDAWEYRNRNSASNEWKKVMEHELQEATDAVFIFGKDYAYSKYCRMEIEILANKGLSGMLQFCWGDGVKGDPAISEKYQEPLPSNKDAAATLIANQITEMLRK